MVEDLSILATANLNILHTQIRRKEMTDNKHPLESVAEALHFAQTKLNMLGGVEYAIDIDNVVTTLREYIANDERVEGLAELPRYGLNWKGHDNAVVEPMPDGYWTPWHIADKALKAARIKLKQQEG